MVSTSYLIERGVPISPSGTGQRPWRRRQVPWRQMEVGDSIFFPYKDRALQMRAHLAATGVKHGIRLISREVDGGVRVWRTG